MLWMGILEIKRQALEVQGENLAMEKLRPRRDLVALRERVAASTGANSPTATPPPPADSPTSLHADDTAAPAHVLPNAQTSEAGEAVMARLQLRGDAADPEAGAGPEQGLPEVKGGALDFSLVGPREAVTSLLDVLV